jgi:chromate transporter
MKACSMQQTVSSRPTPGAWKLFQIWSSIGLQSFGGGASTTFLIQRTFIDRYGWMTMEDFNQYWNLCLFAPGINLIALTVLIGRRLGGVTGILASLVGLLLPSATITCLMAAGFVQIQHLPVVHAILRGVIPATAGIMGVVAFNFARPVIQRAYKEGKVQTFLSLALILLSALALIYFNLPVVVVLPCTALLGMLLFTPWRSRPTPSTPPAAREQEEIAHD